VNGRTIARAVGFFGEGGGMKTRRIQFISAALTFALMSAVATGARAEYRCDKPLGWGDAKACAKAKEGVDALRRYIERTRMIHGLYFWDYWPSPNTR